VRFFGKGSKVEKMTDENQSVDLGKLQREKEKHAAALAGVSSKIQAIEEKARLEREEAERKSLELASLQQKLGACREAIVWVGEKVTQLKETAQGRVNRACDGKLEGLSQLKDLLREISEWELTLAAFKAFETLLATEIEKSAAPA
jgi:vacuolar-type H+-ATPase subunit I/STV1